MYDIVNKKHVVAVVSKDGSVTYREFKPKGGVEQLPVVPNEIEDYTKQAEYAISNTITYLKSVAKLYDIDIKWLISRIKEKLEFELLGEA